MTINSTIRKAGPFIGNGATTTFPFGFKVFAAGDVLAVKLTVSTNVQTTLVLNTDYTVTLNQDQDSNPGGSITLTAGALPSGYTLTMTSDVQNLQPTDLTNQGGFYPDVINDALDRATIQIQQIQIGVDSSIRLPLSSTANTVLPDPNANQLIGWNSTGDGLANIDPGTLASIVAYSTAYADTFTGNGSTVNWTLTRNPGTLYNLDISTNGVTQVPTADYTLSGTTLTTTSAAPLGSVILVKYKEGLPNTSGDSQDFRYLPAGTGAVATTVQAQLRRNFVTPENFGAVGDGVTDDTAAIQRAIDSFTISGQIDGGQIYLPGNYAISDTLTIYNSSMDFYGQGFGAQQGSAKTYIKWIGTASGPMIRVQSSRAVKIRNLRLIGNTTYKPQAGINFYVDNPGSPSDISQNSFNRVENVWIGAYDGNDQPTPAGTGSDANSGKQFLNGILYNGDNTGNNYDIFTNVRIGRCNNGVSFSSNQFGQNLFQGLWVTACEYGFTTQAPVIGIDWFFDNNSVADIAVGGDARLQVYEFASEASYQLAALNTGARLTIYGGSFSMYGTKFGGTVIDGSGGNAVTVDLNDFTLFNDGTDPYVNTPLFTFTSSNDNSNKYFTGRGIRGITAAMINGNLGAGNTNQRFWVDLTVNSPSSSTPLRIQNYLGPNTYSAESVSASRYDIPLNANFKQATNFKTGTLAATATPSVANGDIWFTSGTTAITNFTGGTVGQIIRVMGTGNITITNGASIQLAGATNFAMTDLDVLSLVYVSSNLWREVSRSVN